MKEKAKKSELDESIEKSMKVAPFLEKVEKLIKEGLSKVEDRHLRHGVACAIGCTAIIDASESLTESLGMVEMVKETVLERTRNPMMFDMIGEKLKMAEQARTKGKQSKGKPTGYVG